MHGNVNKSYDFRQGGNGAKLKQPLKLEINNLNELDLINEETNHGTNHQQKIIFNSRQIRKMNNNYVKGGGIGLPNTGYGSQDQQL